MKKFNKLDWLIIGILFIGVIHSISPAFHKDEVTVKFEITIPKPTEEN